MTILEREVKEEFDRVYSRINNISDESKKNTTEIAVLKTLLKALEELPDCFSKLSETLISVEESLKRLDERTRDIDERLSLEIDSIGNSIKLQEARGKVDIIRFISDNWFQIITGIAFISLIIKDFVVK